MIEIDDRPQTGRLLVFRGGGVVRGEHDGRARETHALADHQLGQARTISPAPFLAQDRNDMRIGGRLHGEVLFEAGIPLEGVFKIARALADALLVVQIKRGGIILQNALERGGGKGESLVHGSQVTV